MVQGQVFIKGAGGGGSVSYFQCFLRPFPIYFFQGFKVSRFAKDHCKLTKNEKGFKKSKIDF